MLSTKKAPVNLIQFDDALQGSQDKVLIYNCWRIKNAIELFLFNFGSYFNWNAKEFIVFHGLEGQTWCSVESCLTESPGYGFEAAPPHLRV
jgi:hypothetical protein